MNAPINKVLVIIPDEKLVQTIFNDGVKQKLSAICGGNVKWITSHVEKDVFIENIRDCDACIIGWGSPKLDDDVLAAAGNLKFVGHTAGTLVPYISPAIYDKGVTVVNANKSLVYSTAELAVLLMLSCAWKLKGFVEEMAGGTYVHHRDNTVLGLYGRKVGLIGFGEITKAVIGFIKPFNPEIFVYSSFLSDEDAKKYGVKLASKDDIFKNCDIISLHSTYTERTKNMVTKRELDMIRDGAVFINTARAPLVNEEDLMASLKENRYFAGLDVFHKEPLPEGSPLYNLPNVISTPHVGAYSSYWKGKQGELVVDDLQRFVNGEAMHGQITKEVFDRQSPK